jgi:anti-sigma-K factor RskA
VDCIDRRDLIFLYAAGELDASESGPLREHLATGCPQCAGYLAEAQNNLAMMPLALPSTPLPAGLKQKILNRAIAEARSQSNPMRIGWDRIVLPSAIAAVLAVAITLLVVRQFTPSNIHSPEDLKQIVVLEGQLQIYQQQLADARTSIANMKYAELTGSAQPGAVGHVFLDTKMKNWYFFTCGMKPAPGGKTYELWVINNGQKIPAGIFDVKADGGTATLLGTIPPLNGTGITLAVTDEPAAGPHQVPTGQLQIVGNVE